MRYRKLDANGDYTFGRGQADFYRDQPEAVGQAVYTRLMLWTGQWYLDLAEGTGWNIKVLGNRTANTRDAEIIARTLDTPGVTKIETYSSNLDRDQRKFGVDMKIDTIYGAVRVAEPQ